MNLFMKCEEANTICDKTQYKEATLREKIKLNFHLIWCAFCRSYTRNNRRLTNIIKKSEIRTMPAHDKEILKTQLEREISKK
jgi:hypothetical protein